MKLIKKLNDLKMKLQQVDDSKLLYLSQKKVANRLQSLYKVKAHNNVDTSIFRLKNIRKILTLKM